MTDAFVDTDVIVRFVTGDDPTKLLATTHLFTAVESGVNAGEEFPKCAGLKIPRLALKGGLRLGNHAGTPLFFETKAVAADAQRG